MATTDALRTDDGQETTPASATRHWRLLSPSLTLFSAILFSIAAALATLWIATDRPWLGLELRADPLSGSVIVRGAEPDQPGALAGLRAGDRITALRAGDTQSAEAPLAPIALIPGDLVEEPDSLDSYEDIARFFSRQQQLVTAMAGDTVQVEVTGLLDGATRVLDLVPEDRPAHTLPAVFWVQVFSGLAGVVVGAWIWSLRRSDLASQMFALSGLGLMISALPAAIYSTRELALPADLFALLSALNHAGAHIFGGALIALFLVYPRRLVPPVSLLVLPVILGLWLWADITRLLPTPTVGTYMAILAEMLAIVALVMVQARKVRTNPVESAALRWLGLSVVVGAGAFVGGIAVPLLFGGEPAIGQGYAFAFFFIVYGGIALGIRRYRLFDLGEWSFRILFYVAGAIVLLALDATLIWLLDIERAPAFGASLLLMAFLYLPFRDVLHRRITGQRDMARHELFAVAMEVAFAATPEARAARWRQLLSRLYDPLEIAADPQAVAAVETGRDGLELALPAVAGSPPLRLRYPRAGKGLFGGGDAWLARELVQLIARAAESRDAHERGALEERQRIARDLHDDVGGRLMTGMHGADARTRPLIQAALSDIRAIISGLNGERTPLGRVLADTRHEAARRLEGAGIALDWPPADDGLDRTVLDYREAKALVSSVREAVTNIIRHAGADRVGATLALEDGTLVLTLADNGGGVADSAVDGFGLKNIRQRLEALGGTLSVAPAQPGTRLEMILPLARD